MAGRSKQKGPSAEETEALASTRRLNEEQLALLQEQKAETAKARTAAEAESAKVKAAASSDEARRRRGNTGARSLLTGNWLGFQRGADFGGV